MTDAPIRVGLIGAGGNTTSRHIPGFLKQPGVSLTAVANRTRASGQRVADEFDIPKVYGDWAALLADDEIDAVCIGTWPYMHSTLTIAALEAGKHVLCEARMAMDLADAKSMLAASLRHPTLIAQIVPAPHTLAFDKTIQRQIGSGAIGEIIAIDARIAAGRAYPDGSGPLHWRHDRALSGMNIMSMGIWYEAIMRWVGPARTVMAVGQSVVPHRLDDRGFRKPMEIPDHMDVIGRLEQGGQIRFNVSTVLGNAPDIADVHIFGTDGALRLRQPVGGELELTAAKRGDKEMKALSPDKSDVGGWRVEEEFVNAIRGKEPVTHTDLQTGVRYMEWTEAVTRSNRTGEAIQLPL